MRGTGKADIYMMLAHPVGHAKSPGIFNEIFEECGLDSLMVPITCKPQDFDTFWAGITAAENVRGVIVSVPYKQKVWEKCTDGHARARRVASANSVRRLPDGGWYADNFDGVGFIDALHDAGHDLTGKKVLQVGAGGAGASIAYCLAEAGVAELTLNDIDAERVEKLATLVAKAFPDCKVTTGSADPSGMDIAVNATPMGLKADDPMPMDVTRLTQDMLAVDIVMEPAETAFLAAARAAGCKVQPGRPMMNWQTEAMARFFDIDRTGPGNV